MKRQIFPPIYCDIFENLNLTAGIHLHKELHNILSRILLTKLIELITSY